MTITAPRAARAPGRLRSGRLAAGVVAVPELIPAAVAGFSVGPMALLVAGHFIAPLVLPAGLVGAAIAVWVCGVPRGGADRRTAQLTLVAVLIVLAWCVANSFYTGEDVFARRDPATYTLTARWLLEHGSLVMHTQPGVFGPPPNFDDMSAGFGSVHPGLVYSQGDHLLPALLACAGWVFGAGAILKANVVLGGLALLTFFGLCRRVVGAPFALVAMSALAVSMPMLFLSRDTYTEPLALLLLSGGLSLLHRAVQAGRTADFALAGLVVGASALVRIDSLVSVVTLLVPAAILLAVAPPGSRARAGRRVGALFAAAVPVIVLSWLDLTWLSFGYYRDQRQHILPIFAVGALLAVVGAGVVILAWRSGSWLRRQDLRRIAFRVVAVILVVAVAVLISRPWWLTTRITVPNDTVGEAQKAAGLAFDPTRAYDEDTVNWQAAYFGWPTIGLAVCGYLLLLRRLIVRRDYRLLGVLTMGLAMSVLYLVSSQITADQPWASRRYLPVVMPVLLMAAASALRTAWSRWGRAGRAVSAVGIVAVVGIPLLVSIPLVTLREEVPQLSQVRALCAAVAPSGAVVTVDQSAQLSYLQTIRSYCDVPAIAVLDAKPDTLVAMRSSVAEHGRTLYVLGLDASTMPFATAQPPAFSSVVTSRWPSTIHAPPSSGVTVTITVYLGTVRTDGRLDPVAPVS